MENNLSTNQTMTTNTYYILTVGGDPRQRLVFPTYSEAYAESEFYRTQFGVICCIDQVN